MKIIYEFDPMEDEHELIIYQNASNMHSAITDIYSFLRNKSKYTDETTLDLEEFREWFHNILSEYKVDL